jgi:hypothetical protein
MSGSFVLWFLYHLERALDKYRISGCVGPRIILDSGEKKNTIAPSENQNLTPWPSSLQPITVLISHMAHLLKTSEVGK